MASTVGARYACGRHIVATHASDNKVLTVGFSPRKARVTNLTNAIAVEMCDALTLGSNIKVGADGAVSVLASGGIEPTHDASGNYGIKIPGDMTDICDTDGEDLLWEAWG